ncbi:MAG: topoisomerase IV, partial [Clostridia bacterium]|nr:topoisomerase IV [Clostridia bacterium]
YMVATKDYSGSLLFFFENGKCARVAVKSYETKTNRKKLISAYSDKSPLVAVFTEEGKPLLLLLNSTNGKLLLIDAAQVPLKTSKDTIGVAVMTMKPQHKVAGVRVYTDGMLSSPHRYRVKNLPAAGARAAEGDELNKQLSIF